MMCVPAKKHHGKIHGARSEDKMEKTIPIWYVISRLHYVAELQTIEPYFFYLIGAKTFHVFINLI